MGKPGNKLESLFYKGTYSEVLRLSVDAAQWSSTLDDIPFVVGALSFTGRLEEAELLIKKLQKQKKLKPLIIARFFLGIGLTRLSEYSKAQKVFEENFNAKNKKSDLELFFIYQGMSFFEFFSGQLDAAEKSSKLSFEHADNAKYLYGKVLSSDIRAHILINLGEISRGLKLLTSVRQLSEQLGNSSLPKAIYISETIYKARFGLEPNLKELLHAIQNVNPGDNYSHANLLLEYSRQLSIRGKSDKAYRFLDEASRLIYSNKNHRQEVTLNLRYAYLMFLSGDYSRALNALSSAKRALRPGVDHLLEVETMGLEFKLFSNLYMKKECEVLFPKLQKLSKKFGNTYQIRFLNRDENKIASSAVRAGEDLLGDLYDQIRAEPENAINSILKTDYHAFLYDLLPLSREASVIYLDLEPGTLTLFQRGNVNHTDGLTPQLRKIILCLSEGKEMDKEELITRVWGYKYDPLRHDNIVYSAMTLLRKLLGEKSSWLVTTESGYKWLAGVEIKSHLTNEAQNIEAIIPKKLDVNFNTLNFRQMKILQFLKNNESIDVQKCKKLFNVSDITASRDLSSLTRSNSLIRVGKGRAIRYVLVDNRLFGGNS